MQDGKTVLIETTFNVGFLTFKEQRDKTGAQSAAERRPWMAGVHALSAQRAATGMVVVNQLLNSG
jgi:hypothetical protein